VTTVNGPRMSTAAFALRADVQPSLAQNDAHCAPLQRVSLVTLHGCAATDAAPALAAATMSTRALNEEDKWQTLPDVHVRAARAICPRREADLVRLPVDEQLVTRARRRAVPRAELCTGRIRRESPHAAVRVHRGEGRPATEPARERGHINVEPVQALSGRPDERGENTYVNSWLSSLSSWYCVSDCRR
jgi:hypothetical protein